MESKSLSALYLCGDDSNEMPGFDTMDLDLGAPSGYPFECMQNGSSSSDNPNSHPCTNSDRVSHDSQSQANNACSQSHRSTTSDSVSSQIDAPSTFSTTPRSDSCISKSDSDAGNGGVSLDANPRTETTLSSFLEPLVNYEENARRKAENSSLKSLVRQKSGGDSSAIKTSMTKVIGGAAKFQSGSSSNFIGTDVRGSETKTDDYDDDEIEPDDDEEDYQDEEYNECDEVEGDEVEGDDDDDYDELDEEVMDMEEDDGEGDEGGEEFDEGDEAENDEGENVDNADSEEPGKIKAEPVAVDETENGQAEPQAEVVKKKRKKKKVPTATLR